MAKTIVRVVSLESAVERRRVFAADAASVGLEWSFFPACTHIEPPLVHDQQAVLVKSGRPMNAAELGCYTSHYKVWEQFVASDADQVIIMEDDIMVDWPFVERLSRHDLASHGVHILKMFATHMFPSEVAAYSFSAPHSHLLRSTGQILGMQCYLLTRRGAEALLKLGQTIERPVDWLISQAWELDLPIYCLFPFPVLERQGPSSIVKSEAPPPLSREEKVLRLAWRFKHKSMQQVANRRHAKAESFGAAHDTGGVVLR